MDRIKRALFPLIVFLLIAAALIYRLSSCVSSAGGGGTEPAVSGSAGPSAPSSPSPSPEPAASPGAPFSNDDIIKLYKKAGFEVREIRDAGGAALVRYCPSGGDGDIELSGFAWFDRATGERCVVFDGLTVDRYDVAEDRTLTVLTTGRDDGGRQRFPELCISAYSDAPESVRYKSDVLPYYMPADRSIAVGDDRPAYLKSVSVDIDAVTVGFVPRPGDDGGPDQNFRNIPKTSVVASGGVCYITFYNTTPAADIRLPKAGAGDGLRSFAGLKSDGTNTVLTLKLSDSADRYNISEGFSPGDGMPYAVFRFRSEEDIRPPYPKGW